MCDRTPLSGHLEKDNKDSHKGAEALRWMRSL